MKIIVDKHSCSIKDIYGKVLIKFDMRYSIKFDYFIREILNNSQYNIYINRDTTFTISKKSEKTLMEKAKEIK